MSFPRKVILNNRNIIKKEAVVSIPGVENLIADALGTIEIELVKFRNKVGRGESLDPSEGRLLTLYVKSLIDLSKESRERSKNDDLSKLSNEELLELAKKLTPNEDTSAK